MTEIQDANERFNSLWEEIGAKRITIGDEEQGVEIVVDEDLSIFNILDKLKAETEASQRKGEISKDDAESVKHKADEIKQAFDTGLYDRLGAHFRRLIHK